MDDRVAREEGRRALRARRLEAPAPTAARADRHRARGHPDAARRYFIADLLKPPDPGMFDGPYAFGLSAYSPVLTSFAGGDGQVGIHGTNRAELLGSDVSHGCIRLANGTITALARQVPVGSPVTIAD